jgi:hypothetical protein
LDREKLALEAELFLERVSFLESDALDILSKDLCYDSLFFLE